MKPVIRTTLAGIGLFAATSGAGHAGVTIHITDAGPDVVVTASGTLNLSDLTASIGSFLATGPGMVDYGGALGSSQGLLMGDPTSAYTLRSGPTFSGPAYPFFGAERSAQTQLAFSTATGDLLSLGFSESSTGTRVGIGVSNSYVSGASLSSTGTWTGLELSRLGVAADSSYTWTWGSGATADFLTIQVAAIPEPSTYALMIAGLGLVGFAARKLGHRQAGSE